MPSRGMVALAVLLAAGVAGCGGQSTATPTRIPVPTSAVTTLPAQLTFTGGLVGVASDEHVASGGQCGPTTAKGYEAEIGVTVGGAAYTVTVALASYRGPATYSLSDTIAAPSVFVQALVTPSVGSPVGYISSAGSGAITIDKGATSGSVDDVQLIPGLQSGSASFVTVSGDWHC